MVTRNGQKVSLPSLPAAGVMEVRLTCPGGYKASFVDNRYFKIPCREKKCRRPGHTTYHLYDRWGRFVKDEWEPDSERDSRKGAS